MSSDLAVQVLLASLRISSPTTTADKPLTRKRVQKAPLLNTVTELQVG